MALLASAERRDFQRLVLDEPLAASVGVRPVRITDVTVRGARVLYDPPEIDEGVCTRLTFRWHGDTIDVACQVTRTLGTPAGGQFVSGVTFQRTPAALVGRLRSLMLLTATQQLTKRRIGLGLESGFLVDAETTAMRAPYLTMQFREGVWERQRSFSARQPRSGFTVLAGMSEVELQRVCATYRDADVIGRQLLRVLAEIAIAEAHERTNGMDLRIVEAPAIF